MGDRQEVSEMELQQTTKTKSIKSQSQSKMTTNQMKSTQRKGYGQGQGQRSGMPVFPTLKPNFREVVCIPLIGAKTIHDIRENCSPVHASGARALQSLFATSAIPINAVGAGGESHHAVLKDIKSENPIYYDSCVICKKKTIWKEGKFFCQKNCGLYFPNSFQKYMFWITVEDHTS
jgi:hypothetical protein